MISGSLVYKTPHEAEPQKRHWRIASLRSKKQEKSHVDESEIILTVVIVILSSNTLRLNRGFFVKPC